MLYFFKKHIVNRRYCYLRFTHIGSFHRSTSDRRRTVQDQDTLLFLGSNTSCALAAKRKELSYILPDARRTESRGER